MKPTPGLRFHVALCEEKLGQLVAALADYTAADQMAREQNNKDVIDAVAEPLKTLRIRVPTLTIEVPRGARLASRARWKGDRARSVRRRHARRTGHAPVTARAQGKRPFSTQVTLHEREADTATVKWVDVPPEPALNVTPEKPVETKSGPVKVGAIVATAASAVLLGVGIGAFVAADGAHSDLAAQCPLLTNCDDLRNKVRAWDWVALGTWIGAAGVAVVAVVLWAKPSAPQASSARIELRPGGLAFTGRF